MIYSLTECQLEEPSTSKVRLLHGVTNIEPVVIMYQHTLKYQQCVIVTERSLDLKFIPYNQVESNI